MRILSMTATFGKLEHETLTLQPGLNVITAPNEWGKSTWCAFLVAMLYGIDTRAKSTKTLLADKEHYAPWSGSPMSGSIRLLWQGKDITLQRHTAGRIPLGEFRAFETDSGMELPELTAENCGQTLLGVDKNVFLRAGFLRFTDLSDCQDDALRSRLNSLVTTGDESAAGDLLGQKLKELKNRCRYHRSGLLPQALEERQALLERMQNSESRTRQEEKLLKRKRELEAHIRALENHKLALLCADAQSDEEKVLAAKEAKDRADRVLADMEAQSQQMPSRQKAENKVTALNRLRDTWEAIQMEEQMLPTPPQAPEPPFAFRDCDSQQALEQATAHRDEVLSLTPGKNLLPPLLVILGFGALCGGVTVFLLREILLLAIGLGAVGLSLITAGAVLWGLHSKKHTKMLSRKAALAQHYGTDDPQSWVTAAESYIREQQDFDRRTDACRRLRGDLDERWEKMRLTVTELAQGKGLTEALRYWQEVLDFWDAYADAFRDRQQSENHLNALRSMARTAQTPAEPDSLTFTAGETDALLSAAAQELKQLHQLLGQCQGQADALGDDTELGKSLEALNRRIEKLELTCRALELAQAALEQASGELQRRFAPKITQHTRQIFTRLTGGKYPELTLSQDLTLHASAKGENVLRSQLWRSDGTVDQLYFSLRLAAARELTPTAPLVLDDALIRFDDLRLAAALDILKEEAESRQVLLFTCQSREETLLHE